MHPYKQAPPKAFWAKSVSTGYDAAALVPEDRAPLIRAGENVSSAGSCFASNLVPYLEREGLTYFRAQPPLPGLSSLPPENFSYDKFSAAYGNIYTVRQLLQLLRRCLGRFKPREDRWHTSAGVIDPFRPGLRYHAVTDVEFDLLTAQYLESVLRVFRKSDVFIFTLGLTEAWASRADGAIFPACPGTVAGEFDATRHAFVNLGSRETRQDLDRFLREVHKLNPKLRVILTVSPVPLVATATGDHVLAASTYSKSVLRAAAGEAAQAHPFVTYFPSYEIITGPQAPASFFEPDRRSVSDEGIGTVMKAFLAHCELPAGRAQAAKPAPAADTQAAALASLSSAIMDVECEEAAAARGA